MMFNRTLQFLNDYPGTDATIKKEVSSILKKYYDSRAVEAAEEQVKIEATLRCQIKNSNQLEMLHNQEFVNCSFEILIYVLKNNGKVNVVNKIITDNPYLNNKRDSNGNTPIQIALKCSTNMELIELLLKQNIDFHQVDKKNNTLLHLAASRNDLCRIFQILISVLGYKTIFNAKNVYNDNCFHIALRKNNEDIITYIINIIETKTRLQVDFRMVGYNKNLYLHSAAYGDCNETTLNFLTLKTGLVDCRNIFGRTPFQEALLNGSIKAATYFSEKGTDIAISGYDNKNSLHYAIRGDCLSHFKRLTEISIDQQSQVGLPPIHTAISISSMEAMNHLLRNYKPTGELLDNKGNSALHYLAKKNIDDITLDPHLKKYFQQLTMKTVATQMNKTGYTPLQLCIKNKCYVVFTQWLYQTYSKATDTLSWSSQNTSLHIAASVGDWRFVYALLIRGADPDATNADWYTPLHLAMMGNHSECVEILLFKSLRFHLSQCRMGYGIMHYATNCSIDIMKSIIDKSNKMESQTKCTLNDINQRNGDTLYHTAIKNENLEVVELLLTEEIEPKSNNAGENPLHFAVLAGNVKIFKLLVENLDSKTLTEKNKAGKSVLMMICEAGNMEMLDIFCKQLEISNKSPEFQTESGKKSELHFAAANGQFRMMHKLLSYPCILQLIDMYDDLGFTPLHHAALLGNLQTAKILLSYGANKDLITKHSHKTPLHIAVSFNKFEMMQLLIRFGVKLDEVDIDGRTALHLAIVYNLEEFLIYLIKNNADTNISLQPLCQTCLEYAIGLNRTKLMKYLLTCDERLGNDYSSALLTLKGFARQHEHFKILDILNNYECEGPDFNIIKLLSSDLEEF